MSRCIHMLACDLHGLPIWCVCENAGSGQCSASLSIFASCCHGCHGCSICRIKQFQTMKGRCLSVQARPCTCLPTMCAQSCLEWLDFFFQLPELYAGRQHGGMRGRGRHSASGRLRWTLQRHCLGSAWSLWVSSGPTLPAVWLVPAIASSAKTCVWYRCASGALLIVAAKATVDLKKHILACSSIMFVPLALCQGISVENGGLSIISL